MQTELLSLNRSSLYYQPRPPRAEEVQLKHLRDDFHMTGMLDPQVYEYAQTEHRLILTFNGDDFKDLARKSRTTGILFISDNLTDERIDSKLTALLSKSTPNALYGKFTTITGETSSSHTS